MSTDSVKNREYYEANKEEINRIKRERYRTDAKYRRAAIARARAQTALKKITRMARVLEIKHAGRTEQALTFGAMKKRIGRSRDAIYRWQRGGVMPPALYRTPAGHSLYSESQVKLLEALCRAVESHTGITYARMGEMLREMWPKRYSEERVAKMIGKGVLKALSKKGDRGGKVEEGNRQGCGAVHCQERRGKAAARKGEALRRPDCRSACQPRRNAQHGRVRKPEARRRSDDSLRSLTCQGRRSVQ